MLRALAQRPGWGPDTNVWGTNAGLRHSVCGPRVVLLPQGSLPAGPARRGGKPLSTALPGRMPGGTCRCVSVDVYEDNTIGNSPAN